MCADIIIEPMTEYFILWRCLHSGPLTCRTIDSWSSEDTMPREQYRRRNRAFLSKMIKTYGTCAIIARDGDAIVGQLRFYPKAVTVLDGAGGLCLQQESPAGPADDFSDSMFPDPVCIEDRTLAVHCIMTGSPLQKSNPYQRKAIGTRMVRALIQWASKKEWTGIEADAFEDIPVIYEMTGSAGHTFWEKQGFHVIDRHPHPELQDRSRFPEFIDTLEEQAKAAEIPPERARDRIVMRLDL
ncbi:GNAT family N-acetyltransferase [bacterium]|nr:GNAT family N-acetyltransferase [bacterium]